MLDKYFFIPAANKKFIENIDRLEADYFVFDLEDSIDKNDFNEAVDNLLTLKTDQKYWIRFPFFDLNISKINKLTVAGYSNFIVPKISYFDDFDKILSLIKKINIKNSFIILVENPYLLMNLNRFIERFNGQIEGIGLGSHDYAANMNMQHDFCNLNFARNMILNTAKAYNVLSIDIASMEIKDEQKLRAEFKSAVRMGFDAKFFIHPRQINVFENTNFFSEEEIKEAKDITSIVGEKKDYAAFKHRGKIYEKPHLKRLKRINEWAEKYESI